MYNELTKIYLWAEISLEQRRRSLGTVSSSCHSRVLVEIKGCKLVIPQHWLSIRATPYFKLKLAIEKGGSQALVGSIILFQSRLCITHWRIWGCWCSLRTPLTKSTYIIAKLVHYLLVDLPSPNISNILHTQKLRSIPVSMLIVEMQPHPFMKLWAAIADSQFLDPPLQQHGDIWAALYYVSSNKCGNSADGTKVLWPLCYSLLCYSWPLNARVDLALLRDSLFRQTWASIDSKDSCSRAFSRCSVCMYKDLLCWTSPTHHLEAAAFLLS